MADHPHGVEQRPALRSVVERDRDPQRVPAKVVSERLGHNSAGSTSDSYGATFPAQHQEAAEAGGEGGRLTFGREDARPRDRYGAQVVIASTAPIAFLLLLGAFGVGELLVGVGLWRRAQRERPDLYTKQVLILSMSYGLIGITALGAALLQSGVLFIVMAALTLAHVVLRRRLSTRSNS
jgi:hypothetical protein